MKKKNGFISTAVVYSFFFVFLMLLVFVVSSYSNNRTILRVLKADAKNEMEDEYLARYLINHNDEIKMDYHNSALPNGAGDNSYRFSGSNPNNYICFGTDSTSTCTNNPDIYLYRIIGIFDGKIKIIKNSAAYTNKGWSEYLFNTWENSPLYSELNEGDYWSSLSAYQPVVTNTDWYVVKGIDPTAIDKNASFIYNEEYGENKGTALNAFVGLMSISDYGYGTSKANWTTKLNKYSTIKSSNWLGNYVNSWLLPRRVSTNPADTNNTSQAYYINESGDVMAGDVTEMKNIHPTFYLKSNVKKLGGNGTISTPYIVTLSNLKNASISKVNVSITSTTISIETIATASVGTISKYYYRLDDGDWKLGTNNKYTFNNLTPYKKYNLQIKVVDSSGEESNIYTRTIVPQENFANYIMSIYKKTNTQGANGLYYHISSLANSANDNSYRYSGSNPNNYVCFGTDKQECPKDNLYRIIGVFDEDKDGVYNIKLIKADYTTGKALGNGGSYYTTWSKSQYNTYIGFNNEFDVYYWNNKTNSNIWANSNLNTDNLKKFYDQIPSNWKSKIAETTWYVGGMTTANALNYNAKRAYNYEIGPNKNNTKYTNTIGLMYLSDYFYAATHTYWTYAGTNYSQANNYNWMRLGYWEWTISRDSSDSYKVLNAGQGGNGESAANPYSYHAAVRPVFYLNSNVQLKEGEGTRNKPYRIVI